MNPGTSVRARGSTTAWDTSQAENDLGMSKKVPEDIEKLNQCKRMVFDALVALLLYIDIEIESN